MDLESEILKADFKDQAVYVASYIGSDPDKFNVLMRLFFSNELRSCQRASWVVSHCVDKDKSLISPYLNKMVKNLENPVNDATKRSTVRILEKVDIPEPLWEDCLNHCFAYLESASEPVAVKVFSMTILYNLSVNIPEIKNELKLLIEDLLPYGTAGIKSRGRKILAKLEEDISYL